MQLEPVPAAQATVSRRTVLVAEDDADYRDLLSTRLRQEGFEVIEATDGQHALELLAASRADAVIADLRMPRIDGLELCRRLRADPATRALPILILSAVEESAAVGEVVGLGHIWYLGKSAGWDRTLRSLTNLLGSVN